MSFGRTTSAQLRSNEKVLEHIDSYEDHGINSSNLSWKPHIEKTITKANKDFVCLNATLPTILPTPN